jgi:putative ABC transport system permease protein
MILLRLISWPYARKHLVRTILTTAGIVLGVGVFVGMHAANQSVLYALHETVDRVAGATQLQVSAGESGFDEDVLERVQARPEVRVAVPVIEAVVDTELPGQGSIMILAVDMTGDRSLRDYALESGDEAVVDDPLVFLAQPDSLIVTREFADRNHLGANSVVPMRTMDGGKKFVVRGIMSSTGLAKAFGGNLAIMDVYAAQSVFGRGRKFDRIDLAVSEGFTVAQCRAALKQALGPGFQVETPGSRGQQFDSVLRVYSVTMSITSVFALFIGMFIIYNSFAISVTERRSEIGILRALGATRGQIRTLFLVESVVAGIVGSVLGLGFGYLLARGTAGYVGQMLEGVSGIAQRVEDVATEPWLMGLAVGMGILTSMVAAFIPARNAARVNPVQALQKGKYQVLSAGENRARQGVGFVFALASAACLVLPGGTVTFYVGFFLAMLAALLFAPLLALWLTRALRPLLGWLWPVEGALAADSLMQAPRRTSATVSALMLSLALTVALGGAAAASYESITDWLGTALNPDLFVTASPTLTSRSFLFPAYLGPTLRQVNGVEEVQSVRTPRLLYKGTPVMLISVEVEKWAARGPRTPVEGRADQMYRETADGRAAIISQNLSTMKGLHAGDTLELATPSGELRLPVAGVVEDWSDQQGAIFIDRAVYRKWWNDDRVNTFRVYLRKGASVPEVRKMILERLGGNRRLFVLTNAEVRGYITGLTDQWLAVSYSQIAVAVLVAILGIMNTLTVSIMDRRRELGVLQAVGARRRQIRYTIWMEALSIGLVGVVMGLVLGAINLHYVLEMTHRDITGMMLPYRFPVRIALLLFPTILGAAFVAALWPAEAAVRGSLVQALEYE